MKALRVSPGRDRENLELLIGIVRVSHGRGKVLLPRRRWVGEGVRGGGVKKYNSEKSEFPPPESTDIEAKAPTLRRLRARVEVVLPLDWSLVPAPRTTTTTTAAAP